MDFKIKEQLFKVENCKRDNKTEKRLVQLITCDIEKFLEGYSNCVKNQLSLRFKKILRGITVKQCVIGNDDRIDCK